MRSRIIFLLKYYLFWILFAVVSKILFLIYEFRETSSLVFSDYLNIFRKGLQMDLSYGGYIIMLTSVVLAVCNFFSLNMLKKVLSVQTFILLLISSLIIIGDLELFRNWGYHMDATPLFYLKTPKQAMASTPVWLILFLTTIFVIYTIVFFWIFRKFVLVSLKKEHNYWIYSIFYLMIGGLCVIPVRGGLNVAPMNVSFVFFNNKNMYANQAAINPVWNFLYEITHMGKIKENLNYMDDEKAEELVDSIYITGNNFPRFLNTDTPNVVLILLETFTSNALDATPNLKALAKEGIFFSNIYATGNRSDRGIMGVLSALPAHPKVSMLKYPNKMYEQPNLSLDFEANGYTTHFYYAGDINFGGFRSYVTMAFEKIITENDFSGEAIKNRFKWGVHDEYLFEKLYEDIKYAQEPYFYMAFTMSSHEPFEVPMETVIKGEDNGSKLKNSIYYTDKQLGEFIEKCKTSGIWNNTLFVMIADHGTRHIGNLQPFLPEAFHIPMIFTGGALNVKDTVITKIGSQTDLASTLLRQLNWDNSSYKYSKNLLDPNAIPFAFYAFANYAAVVNENGTVIFDMSNKKNLGTNQNPNDLELTKAYLQLIDNELKGDLD